MTSIAPHPKIDEWLGKISSYMYYYESCLAKDFILRTVAAGSIFPFVKGFHSVWICGMSVSLTVFYPCQTGFGGAYMKV